ncbi:hypothetical protein HYD60_02035 [Mycoplasmopsis bovis]|nr:hypothetical protein HYD60_02035 [Mycoplasmopsis bovis]
MISWVCGLVFEEELPEPYHVFFSYSFVVFDLSWFCGIVSEEELKPEPLGSLSFCSSLVIIFDFWVGV